MARKRTNPAFALLWLIPLVVAGAAAAIYFNREQAVRVEAATAQRGPVEQTVTAINSGTVMAAKDAMLVAETIGPITAVHVKEGDRVRAGDVLIEVAHEELDAQVALAEANLRVGTSRVQQAELAAGIYEDVAQTRVGQTAAQREQAETDFSRLENLMSSNAVPQAEYDRASVALRVAKEAEAAAVVSKRETEVRKEEVRSARAALEQLEAALQAAKAARDKSFVRAPFDGLVARVLVELGEGAALGMPVVQLVDSEHCYVEAPFDEANADEVNLGQRARIGIDAHRGVDITGAVRFISPTVTLNPDLSRTLNVEIDVDEEHHGKLVPGMSADVIIVVADRDDVVYVPSQALIREEFVYVVEDGIAAARPVDLGLTNWDRTEVTSGLAAGESIITTVTQPGLVDGAAVRIVEDLDAP